ncbi:MAG: PTS fructose transporter subunit IIA [Thiohalocapsa sp.]
MSVGLLLITHNRIGAELLSTATRMLGCCPLPATAMAVIESDDPDELREQARRCATALDDGAGVLVLTDLFGSTPSNVAAGLRNDPNVLVLSGVNLPMVVRVLNYHGLALSDLADKALSGGHDGLLACPGAAQR